jgi:hypothetical protein
MLAALCAVYVDRFACGWHRLSTTDTGNRRFIINMFSNEVKARCCDGMRRMLPTAPFPTPGVQGPRPPEGGWAGQTRPRRAYPSQKFSRSGYGPTADPTHRIEFSLSSEILKGQCPLKVGLPLASQVASVKLPHDMRQIQSRRDQIRRKRSCRATKLEIQ